MDYTVTFSKNALEELERIVGAMGGDDPPSALQFGNKLLKKATSLGTFPFSPDISRLFKDAVLRGII